MNLWKWLKPTMLAFKLINQKKTYFTIQPLTKNKTVLFDLGLFILHHRYLLGTFWVSWKVLGHVINFLCKRKVLKISSHLGHYALILADWEMLAYLMNSGIKKGSIFLYQFFFFLIYFISFFFYVNLNSNILFEFTVKPRIINKCSCPSTS